MATQFRKQRVVIPESRGSRSIPGSVRFDTPVISSEYLLGGFRFNFQNKDHHIDEVEINIVRVGVSVSHGEPDPRMVHFLLDVKYQDRNADDPWNGYVDVVVAAEVE